MQKLRKLLKLIDWRSQGLFLLVCLLTGLMGAFATLIDNQGR